MAAEQPSESNDGTTVALPEAAHVSLPSSAVMMIRVIAAGVYTGGRALMGHRGNPPPSNGNVDAVPTPAAEVMSVDEAAAFLGLDRNTVYDAAGRGEIPHRRVGKRILLSRTQLVAWLGACKAARVGNG